MSWIKVGHIEDIPQLGSRVVETEAGRIALFRTAKDEIFALKDACPHMGGPLSQGIVHDKTVTCPLHNWRIELETGNAIAPDDGCTNRFDVKLEQGDILLGL